MDTTAIRNERRAVTNAAAQLTRFRKPLPLDHKKVRYPGFHQKVDVFRAGTTAAKGGRLLTRSIIRHESVPTKLRDGTTIYSDILLPASYDDLNHSWPTNLKVPALLAW